jgi:hypothetical protein
MVAMTMPWKWALAARPTTESLQQLISEAQKLSSKSIEGPGNIISAIGSNDK